MREIEFRGKCFINNEWQWVYGYYAPVYLLSKDGKDYNRYCIVSDKYLGRTEMLGCGVQSGLPANYMIKEDALGQYTGLKDKNGSKIFEGDIVKKNVNGKELKGLVEYKDCAFGVRTDNDGSGLFLCFFNECEVIGNIHDNPELLGGENA